MKIRSPLTNRSLYHRQGSATAARSAYRRLGTMVLALVLVLLLMQRASDPEVYRKLFRRLGVPIATPAGIELKTEPDFLPAATPVIDKSQGDFETLISRLSDEERDLLTNRLANLRVNQDVSQSETGSEAADSEINALGASIASAARESGFANPAEIETAVLSEFRMVQPPHRDILDKLQTALDKTYFKTIEDGTVWNGGDFKAFYRTLERVANNGELPGEPVYVGVVPLVEQSIIYRGRHVRTNGEVVRANRIDAKTNPFGVQEYWMLWLRPIDGSERPMVVYCPSVHPMLTRLPEQGDSPTGPMVDVDALFLKRYLYRSVGGYEQAPLLVGSVRLTAAEERTARREQPPASPTFLNSLIAIAAVIAVSVTGWVYWNARRNDQYHRELRGKGRQPSTKFLDQLE